MMKGNDVTLVPHRHVQPVPAEVRYLTEIDHHNHEAFGAVNPADGRGLGFARYIRHLHDPQGAEVAVTVIDRWQRRGLGTELLTRLDDRARQEGIHHFTGLVAAENVAVAGLTPEDLTGIPPKRAAEPSTDVRQPAGSAPAWRANVYPISTMCWMGYGSKGRDYV